MKNSKKLEILIPQYKETDDILKPLLDSVAIQQNINFADIGVIICNDGTDIKLSKEFLNAYPFEIKYYNCEHKGVSATRNACLDKAKAEYVMFCDADDMFYHNCALWFIFNEIKISHFDSMTSVFIEESVLPETKEHFYIERGRLETGGIDSTFVHGKVHKRKYLLNKKIRWNDNLTIHEDSYFNILCQKCSKNVVYCPAPFYLWKWRDESVCRHDPKYILKTYNNMLDSNTALIEEFLRRDLKEDAQFYATSMILDAWLTMNTKQWMDVNNLEYRTNTETRFAEYYHKFKYLFDSCDEMAKNQIIVGIKNRFFQEGLFLEEITFKDWIKKFN